VLSQEGLDAEGTRVALADLPGVSATVASYVYPREAMGFGDVKLMAAVGAFLGWKATLFALIAASLFGTVVGVTLIALGKRQLGSRLPFGPYIALGAVVWLFWGPHIVSAYLNLFLPPETFL
jgi:leader peptidase (prepilin peptidase)/N-methyltransferase